MAQGPDDKQDGPKIDWMGHIRNTLLILVAVVVVLMAMRYFGLRG
jgi:hypothetical protein